MILIILFVQVIGFLILHLRMSALSRREMAHFTYPDREKLAAKFAQFPDLEVTAYANEELIEVRRQGSGYHSWTYLTCAQAKELYNRRITEVHESKCVQPKKRR